MTSQEQQQLAVKFFEFALGGFGRDVNLYKIARDFDAVRYIFSRYDFPEVTSILEIGQELRARGCISIEYDDEEFFFADLWAFFSNFVEFVVLRVDFGGAHGWAALDNFRKEIQASLPAPRTLRASEELRLMLRRVFSDTAASNPSDDICYGEIMEHLGIFRCVELENIDRASDLELKYQKSFLLAYFAHSGALDTGKALEIEKIKCVVVMHQHAESCLKSAALMQEKFKSEGSGKKSAVLGQKSLQEIFEEYKATVNNDLMGDFSHISHEFAYYETMTQFEMARAAVLGIEHTEELPNMFELEKMIEELLEQRNQRILEHVADLSGVLAVRSVKNGIEAVQTANYYELSALDEKSVTLESLSDYLINTIAQQQKERAFGQFIDLLCPIVAKYAKFDCSVEIPRTLVDEHAIFNAIRLPIKDYIGEETKLADERFASILADFYIKFVDFLFSTKLSHQTLKKAANAMLDDPALEQYAALSNELAAAYLRLKERAIALAQPDRQATILEAEYEEKARALYEELNGQAERLAGVIIGKCDNDLSVASLADELRNIFVADLQISMSDAQLGGYFDELDSCIFEQTKMMQIEAFRGVGYDCVRVGGEIDILNKQEQALIDYGANYIKSALSVDNLQLIDMINQSISRAILEQEVTSAQCLEASQFYVLEFYQGYQRCSGILRQAQDVLDQNSDALFKCDNYEMLSKSVEKLTQMYHLLHPEYADLEEPHGVIKEINDLAVILFCDCLQKASVSPTFFAMCCSLLLELQKQWNTNTAKVQVLLQKYTKALTASGICREIWSVVDEQVRCANEFVMEYDAFSQQECAALRPERKTSGQSGVGNIFKEAHDRIAPFYEPVQFAGRVFEFLLRVETLVWSWLEQEMGAQCLMQKTSQEICRAFVTKFQQCAKEFEILHTDYVAQADRTEIFELDLQDTAESTQRLFERLDYIDEKFARLDEIKGYDEFSAVFELHIELQGIQSTVNSILESVKFQMQQRLPQPTVDQLYNRLCQLFENTIAEFDLSEVDACFQSYNQNTSFGAQKIQLEKLQKAVEARIANWTVQFISYCKYVGAQFQEAKLSPKYAHSKEVLLQQLKRPGNLAIQGKQCEQLQYIFTLLNQFLDAKQSCAKIQQMKSKQFKHETATLLEQYKKNVCSLANQLQTITNRAVALKTKYLLDLSPNELLELKQIIQWYWFLERAMTKLIDMSDNTKIAAQIRKIAGNGQFEALELPPVCEIAQQLSEISINMNELEQLTHDPLDIPTNAVLQNFIFEDVLYEYNIELKLSETTEAHVQLCRNLRVGKYSVFGFTDVPVNCLRRVTAFNLYCERVRAALSQSIYAGELLKSILSLEQNEEIWEMVTRDADGAHFCLEFDSKCQTQLTSLFAGNSSQERTEENDFRTRSQLCAVFGTPGYPYELIYVMNEFQRSIDAELTNRKTSELRDTKSCQAVQENCSEFLEQCRMHIFKLKKLDEERWTQDAMISCERVISQIAYSVTQIMSALLQIVNAATGDSIRKETLNVCATMLEFARKLDAQVSDLQLARGLQESTEAYTFCERFINLVHTCILAANGIISDVCIEEITGKYKQRYDDMAAIAEQYCQQAVAATLKTQNNMDDEKVRNFCAIMLQEITEIARKYAENSATVVEKVIQQILLGKPLLDIKPLLLEFAKLQENLLTDSNTQLAKMIDIVNSPLILEHVQRQVMLQAYHLFESANCVSKTLKQLVISYGQANRRVDDARSFMSSVEEVKKHHLSRQEFCYDAEAAKEAYERAEQKITEMSQNHIQQLQEEINAYCSTMDAMVENLLNLYAEHFEFQCFDFDNAGVNVVDKYDIMDEVQNVARDFANDVHFKQQPRDAETRTPDKGLAEHADTIGTYLLCHVLAANCYAEDIVLSDRSNLLNELAKQQSYAFSSEPFCKELEALHQNATHIFPEKMREMAEKYSKDRESFCEMEETCVKSVDLTEFHATEVTELYNRFANERSADYEADLRKLEQFESKFKAFVAKPRGFAEDAFEPRTFIQIEGFLNDVAAVAFKIEESKAQLLLQQRTQCLNESTKDAFERRDALISGLSGLGNAELGAFGALLTHFTFEAARRAPEQFVTLIGEQPVQIPELEETVRKCSLEYAISYANTILPRELGVSNVGSLEFELDTLQKVIGILNSRCDIDAPAALLGPVGASRCAVVERLGELIRECGRACITKHESVTVLINCVDRLAERECEIDEQLAEQETRARELSQMSGVIEREVYTIVCEALSSALPLYYSGFYMDMCAWTVFIEQQRERVVDLFDPQHESATSFAQVAHKCKELSQLIDDSIRDLVLPSVFCEFPRFVLKCVRNSCEFLIDRKLCRFEDIANSYATRFDDERTAKERQRVVEEVAQFVVKASFMESIQSETQVLGQEVIELDFSLPESRSTIPGLLRRLHAETVRINQREQEKTLRDLVLQPEPEDGPDLRILSNFLEQQQSALETEMAAPQSPCKLTHLLSTVQQARISTLRYNTLATILNSTEWHGSLILIANYAPASAAQEVLLGAIAAEANVLESFLADSNSTSRSIRETISRAQRVYKRLEDTENYYLSTEKALTIFLKQSERAAYYNAFSDIITMLSASAMCPNADEQLAQLRSLGADETALRFVDNECAELSHLSLLASVSAEFVDIAAEHLQTDQFPEYAHLACEVERRRCHALLELHSEPRSTVLAPLVGAVGKLAQSAELAFLQPVRNGPGEPQQFGVWKQELLAIGDLFFNIGERASQALGERFGVLESSSKPVEAQYRLELDGITAHTSLDIINRQSEQFFASEYSRNVFYIASARFLAELRKNARNAFLDAEIARNVNEMEQQLAEFIQSRIGLEKAENPELLRAAAMQTWKKYISKYFPGISPSVFVEDFAEVRGFLTEEDFFVYKHIVS